MKSKDKVFKACANCKYFKMHYVKSRTSYLVAFGGGACENKVFTVEERKKLPYEFTCDSWQAVEKKNCSLEEFKEDLFQISVHAQAAIAKIIQIEKN